MVTASGSPSGMATTRMVIPVVKALTMGSQLLTIHMGFPSASTVP